MQYKIHCPPYIIYVAARMVRQYNNRVVFVNFAQYPGFGSNLSTAMTDNFLAGQTCIDNPAETVVMSTAVV